MSQNLKDQRLVGGEAGVGRREELSRQRIGMCRDCERKEYCKVIQIETLNRKLLALKDNSQR